jgi:hypothetical protein
MLDEVNSCTGYPVTPPMRGTVDTLMVVANWGIVKLLVAKRCRAPAHRKRRVAPSRNALRLRHDLTG